MTKPAVAADLGRHYMDRFTFAERATDWRANNNIAESIFNKMAQDRHPMPDWIICGAGTGGTSATIGRYVRSNRNESRICVANPEHSVFHRHWSDRSVITAYGPAGLIGGIGRPRVEASFLPDAVDRMIAVPDAMSIAAARVISRRIGRLCGGSTGTNIWASAIIASQRAEIARSGSNVSILCEDGARYQETFFR